jgi:hypothetical protein
MLNLSITIEPFSKVVDGDSKVMGVDKLRVIAASFTPEHRTSPYVCGLHDCGICFGKARQGVCHSVLCNVHCDAHCDARCNSHSLRCHYNALIVETDGEVSLQVAHSSTSMMLGFVGIVHMVVGYVTGWCKDKGPSLPPFRDMMNLVYSSSGPFGSCVM